MSIWVDSRVQEHSLAVSPPPPTSPPAQVLLPSHQRQTLVKFHLSACLQSSDKQQYSWPRCLIMRTEGPLAWTQPAGTYGKQVHAGNLRLHVDVKRYRDGVFDVKMMRAPLGERGGITKALIRGQKGGSTSEPSVVSALTYLSGRLSQEKPEMWRL